VSFAATPAALPAMPYLDELSAALERARLANRESLAAAARIVEKVVAGDGIVYLFGSGHSQLAALELNRRAGSIAGLQVVFDPSWGAAEHVEGYAETLLEDAAPGPRDCLIAISHSGTTVAAMDVARRARAAGAQVIAVTSPRAAFRANGHPAESEHGPARRLSALADVVLDDGAAETDPGISVAGLGICVGPTSTVVAAALLHEIVVDAVRRLAARGLEPPVLRPNSEEGGRQHNQRLRDRYRGRVRMVP
jgi:uncharacterized phosphosugar-binding protein